MFHYMVWYFYLCLFPFCRSSESDTSKSEPVLLSTLLSDWSKPGGDLSRCCRMLRFSSTLWVRDRKPFLINSASWSLAKVCSSWVGPSAESKVKLSRSLWELNSCKSSSQLLELEPAEGRSKTCDPELLERMFEELVGGTSWGEEHYLN